MATSARRTGATALAATLMLFAAGCAGTWTVPQQPANQQAKVSTSAPVPTSPSASASKPVPTAPDLPCLGAYRGACECGAAAATQLQQLGIAPDVIAGGFMDQEVGTEFTRFDGYRFSVRPRNCSIGEVTVRLTPTCHVQQIYSTGECQVAGVTHVRTKR